MGRHSLFAGIYGARCFVIADVPLHQKTLALPSGFANSSPSIPSGLCSVSKYIPPKHEIITNILRIFQSDIHHNIPVCEVCPDKVQLELEIVVNIIFIVQWVLRGSAASR